MNRRDPETPAGNLLQQMLGGIECPGDLVAFGQALNHPWGNIMRARREVSAAALPFESDVIDWYRLGRRPVDGSARPSRSLRYAAGDYFVQDAGSLLALAALEADSAALEGKLVCDLCAAPGGKASAVVEAFHASSLADGSGFLLANEVIRSRRGALQLNLARTGSDRYAISTMDPEQLADRLPGVFDVVLVDAPCSGQAMISRGKQKKSSLTMNQIEHSAARQNRILDSALRLLRDGGQLCYSTCTFAEAENEGQVTRLLENGRVSATPRDRLGSYQSAEGCYRLWPHLHHCAGSFAASMVAHQIEELSPRKRKREHRTKSPADLQQWYDRSLDEVRPHVLDSVLIGWPLDAPAWVDSMAVAGPELAHRTGQTWKPSHAGALRRVARGIASQRVDLDGAAARAFLRGETVATTHNGWQIASFADLPLGWIKGTGGVGKNHLPTAARISGQLFD